jgi:hypothetical protein
MDPLQEALIKHYGMSPDLAGRVAQNLASSPGPHPGYEAAEQDVQRSFDAGTGAAPIAPQHGGAFPSGHATTDAERQRMMAATGPNPQQVATTSAAISQQFGVPPQTAAQLASQLHGVIPPEMQAGMIQGQLGVKQREAFPQLQVGPATVAPDPQLEIGPVQVEPQVGLVPGKPKFEVPKGQKIDPGHLQAMAANYWAKNKDPYISTYWSKPEHSGVRDEEKALFLAHLKALRATDPAAAKAAVSAGFKRAQDDYRKQQKKRDYGKRHGH